MLVNQFSNRVVSVRVTCDQGIFKLKGKLHLNHRSSQVYYKAADPSDNRLSVNGSGLPFPNADVAFGGINSGQARVDRYGNFEFQVVSPNSYYTHDLVNHIGQGKILVAPNIKLTIICLKDQSRHDFNIDLSKAGIPLRSLGNLPGKTIRSTGRNTPAFVL